jgi:NAD(P)H-hydrate epimerase
MADALLPVNLYTAAQVRELDRLAIERAGLSANVLMGRAGEAAFALLRTLWPRARRLVVVCGSGNNGGDGYVVARMAMAAGLAPLVLAVGRPREGAAHAAFDICAKAGVAIRDFQDHLPDDADVIVDALLGTGLARVVEGRHLAAIEAINRSGCSVLAVDLPSGMNADTGAVMGAAVRADATLTFIGAKLGLYTGAGPEHAGRIYYDDLDVPSAVHETLTPAARRITPDSLAPRLGPRARNGHKGDYGRVLVIGGGEGMPGAAALCGEAAYRAGAGLVTVATHPSSALAVAAARPEMIVHAVGQAEVLVPLVKTADVIAIGPGLGQTAWSQRMLGVVLESRRPLVVDADGLNLLAAEPQFREDWVLTPHPGEAARLLDCAAHEVQRDRPDCVRRIAERFGGVVVLKGAGTLVAENARETVALCDRGNPGMASGGMGDVLTGMIAGLLAQGVSRHDAACIGVWAHAAAGDDAAQGGEAGLLASDLYPFVRARLHALRHAAGHPRPR